MSDNRRSAGDTKTFNELSYADQVRSINARILVLKRSILANARRAREENRSDPTQLRIAQVQEMLASLQQ